MEHQQTRHDKLLLTVEEAAQVLNLGRSLMYELILSGQILSLKIGRARRIPPEELQAFVDKQLAACLTTPVKEGDTK
jgi:excisionase family DNA binding protein